jgi:hypothetical protein
MNLKNIILAATLAGVLLAPVVSSHAAVVVSTVVTDSDTFTAPIPIQVVSPVEVPRRYQNETIRLSLTVDATGRAKNVELLTGRDPSLVKRLLPAISRWQFKPATLNGRPVAADVVLPLQLVDGPTS